ncbi:MAG: preprotein translocase subunit SecG, partial [Thermodesulfovibrionales bacterium]|nr:preprotein translocase subunit SecG [Thermodesulfovibrionales bacterium]
MPLLNKVTTLVAITFMVTSIALAYISSHKSTSSVMKDFDVQKTQENALERSAEPLPQSGSPDMPLTPAETPAPQEVGQQVQEKQGKVEVPASEGKTESKEK